jgi:hypothetical protein
MAETGEGKKEEADYKRLHSFPLIRVWCFKMIIRVTLIIRVWCFIMIIRVRALH